MAITISGTRKSLAKAKKRAKATVNFWTSQRHYYGWCYKYGFVDEHVILFESFHGKTVSDSPLHMLRAFLEDPRSKQFTIYYATSNATQAEHRRLVEAMKLPVRLVAVESWEYARVLATAKYLVNNSSFPAYFTRKPEQRYIQTWHGTPLKTLGKQMRLGIESMYNVQHNFLQANVLTFPNEFTRSVMMRDYNLEDLYTGTVALLGYPRNRVFFDEATRASIRAYYGLEGYEAFAYMPTWRGVNNYTVDIENYRTEVLGFLNELDKAMRPDQILFVNFHSMVAGQFGDFEFDHIFPFPTNRDNYEFLNAMDALITDYSSVFFDFSITRRPVILFAYDEEEYLADRGMYLDIDDLPFQKVTTIEELAESVKTGSFRAFDYAGTSYESDFLPYDSPDNARRALSLLFGEPDAEPNDVPLLDYSANTKRPWRTLEPTQQASPADIKTACEFADPERDIVMFLRSKFNQDKSRMLHDNYRDAFNFVFITKAYTCTALEEHLARRDERMRAVIDARERQRILPGIDIPSTPQRNLYTGEWNSNHLYAEDELPHVRATIELTEEGDVAICVHECPYELQKLVIFRKRTVALRRTLTDEEKESNTVCAALKKALRRGEFPEREKLRLLLEGTDRETGWPVPILIDVDNDAEFWDDDRTQGLFKPTFRAPDPTANAEGASGHGSANRANRTSRHRAETSTEQDGMVLAPFKDNAGVLCLFCSPPGSLLRSFKYAKLVRLSTSNGKVHLQVALRDGAFVVEDLVLVFRTDVTPLEVALPYTMHVQDGWLHIDSVFAPESLELYEVYWDAYVVVGFKGLREFVPIKVSLWQHRALKVRNQQWRIGAGARPEPNASADRSATAETDSENPGKVLFTHVSKGSLLSFAYRDYYPALDTYALRLREFAALAAYFGLLPYWNRKRLWLVYEKFSSLAQDNAFYFFEYCMSLPESQHDHIYYVIDKSKPDYANVARHDDHVLDFMSFKHILYSMAADLYIASDSRTHLYVWRNKPSIVRGFISKHKIFFLQHGVTAMKQVAYLFGKTGSNPMTYFLTTSAREQQIVVENFGYTANQAPILGFSRWDVLEDRSSADDVRILLMPTWRPWLEEQGDDVFLASEYFERYSSLIQSKELAGVLERHNAHLRFFIHPKLHEQLRNFSTPNGRVELVAQGSEPLNQVMMECNMLVTDYSSVAWDMLYMDKPVVFYQFDQDLYEEAVGSYVDLNEDLPGDVCKTEQDAISAIERCIVRGCTLKPEDAKKAQTWLPRKDAKNRQRTYNFIVDRGF